jgi:hypothetical protein
MLFDVVFLITETLVEQGVSANSTIDLIGRLPGGAGAPSLE